MVFNQITKRAIVEAFAQPHELDMDKVDAQQARRLLDRIVGYELSPLLCAKISNNLSAGRVQSVAVRLVVEREREIRSFVPAESWSINVCLTPDTGRADALAEVWQAFLATGADGSDPTVKERNAWLSQQGCVYAELVKLAGAEFKAADVSEARRAAELLGLVDAQVDEKPWEAYAPHDLKLITLTGRTDRSTAPPYRVADVQKRRTTSRPNAPFTTATLQQSASSMLGFAPSRTMRLAQELYEGVDLGKEEGPVGLITYMRTDSTNLSGESIAAMREMISADFGPAYLPERPNVYGSTKRAQEAHEAIRPTRRRAHPAKPQGQAAQRPVETLRLDLAASARLADDARPVGQHDHPGRSRHPRRRSHPADDRSLAGVRRLPARHRHEQQRRRRAARLAAGHRARAAGGTSQAGIHVAPAAVYRGVAGQEARGGGDRPTQYVRGDHPDRAGSRLRRAAGIAGCTRRTKARSSPTSWWPTSRRSWTSASPRTWRTSWTRSRRRTWTGCACCGSFTARSASHWIAPRPRWSPPDPSPAPIPARRVKHRWVYRWGRNGRFLSCSKYPECKSALNIDREGKPIEMVVSEQTCPDCGQPMLLRQSRRGPFLGCSGYPDCSFTMPCDEQGQPLTKVQPEEITDTCPECQGKMVVRFGRSGALLGCEKYPKCRATKPLPPGVYVEKPKPEPAGVRCDKCGRDMVIRKSRRGPFISCSGFPRCRNAVPMDKRDELKAKEAAGEIPPPPAEPVGKGGSKKAARVPVKADGKVDLEALGPPPPGYAWTRTGRPVVEVWPEDTLHCPECGGEMSPKTGRFGVYFGCGAFPKCRFTANLRGEAKKRSEVEVPTPAKPKPVPTDIPCPECDANMLVRTGRTGEFLGCSRYPQCKATQPMPEGMTAEQLATQSATK